MRRALAATLAVLLAGALGVAVVRSNRGGASIDRTPVHGLSGSEKMPFFDDPRVVARFAELGLDIDVNPAGSREIASEIDLGEVDFAFPAGAPAATRIESGRPALATFTPFVTPMAIATWRPVVDALRLQGVITDRDDHLVFDVGAFLALVDAETRWSDIDYPSERLILVSTTDVRTSNSAAMFLALVSYARNGNSIVTDRTGADQILDQVWPVFAEQGFTAQSTQEPFDAYLVRGAGAVPMVMIYESQFVAEAASESSAITDDMVLVYPGPTLFTTHTLLAFTDPGRRLGEALVQDEELRELATSYGLRVDDASFRAFTGGRGIVVAHQLLDTIDPPSYEVLEYMIADLERRYGS